MRSVRVSYVRINLLQWTDEVGIVESDVSEIKVATASQTNRCAGIESADARNVPSGGKPSLPEQSVERQVPVIAHNQVMPQVERRWAVVSGWIARIILRRVAVQRMSVGIAHQQ